ncbi:dynein regulatory complex subunit 2 [Chelonus insularis]|uniref:dynein regulatory complex subunit 2 n=1 Tax=Chelonus insularis TaxID=460826 RepID=UPI00158E789B|nr:dynein regulatory complex subunit 2 [Chelonus insularis]
MPAKKKKGNKLAKMSDEERLRYLQHRAEVELEAKRRKQQLIAAFAKNKLRREEGFFRLNTSKINEQWRFHLRQIKCKELYDEVGYLWKNFDYILRTKNAIIKTLYEDLEKSDINHRRLQEVHIEMIDKLIKNHKRSLESLHEHYIKSVMLIKFGEIREMNQAQEKLHDGCEHIEIILYAQQKLIDDKLMITRTRNAINTYNIEYTKIEAVLEMKQQIGTKMIEHWRKFNKIISGYQYVTLDKWKQYENLKTLDEDHKRETTNFPQLLSVLNITIESLRNRENALTDERNKIIIKLKKEIEMLRAHIFKLRQKINIDQAMNKIQLKRLTVISNKVIEKLEKVDQKSHALKVMINICSNFEPLIVYNDRYILEQVDTFLQDEGDVDLIISPYEQLEKFWKQFSYIKVKNFLIIKQYNQLIAENQKLKQFVRSYFNSGTRSSTAKLLY